MILTQEINDILKGIPLSEEDEEMNDGFFEGKINLGQIPPDMAGPRKSAQDHSSNNSKDIVSSVSRNADKRKMANEYETFKQKIIKAKATREPYEEEEEKT